MLHSPPEAPAVAGLWLRTVYVPELHLCPLRLGFEIRALGPRPPLDGVAIAGPLPLVRVLSTELRPGPVCDPPHATWNSSSDGPRSRNLSSNLLSRSLMPIFGSPLQLCEALLDLVELAHPAILLYGPDDGVRELRDHGGHSRVRTASEETAATGIHRKSPIWGKRRSPEAAILAP